MLNRVVITGRLTRDPKHSTTAKTNTPTAQFTIAVDDPVKGPDGNKITSFIDVIAWNSLADSVAKNLRKGALVGVDGRLRQRSWETDGKKNSKIEIIANQVEFLEPKTTREIPNEDFGYQSDEEEEVESSPALNFADEPENLDRESKNLETIEEPIDDDMPF